MNTLEKYSAVFGRAPLAVRRPKDERHVGAAAFPPLKRGFWRGLFSEAHDVAVAITYGLSSHEMPVPSTAAQAIPSRIELIALSSALIGGGESGSEDVMSEVLRMIADHIVDADLVVGVGHTLDLQAPLAPNIEMSGILFALPVGVDSKRIMRCSRAGDLLCLVPLTANELQLAQEKDVGALLDLFERNGVDPVFNCFRKSVA